MTERQQIREVQQTVMDLTKGAGGIGLVLFAVLHWLHGHYPKVWKELMLSGVIQ